MLIQPFRISRYAHAFIGAVLDGVGETSIDVGTTNLRALAEVWLESAVLQKAPSREEPGSLGHWEDDGGASSPDGRSRAACGS
jgi:hypothetical protein